MVWRKGSNQIPTVNIPDMYYIEVGEPILVILDERYAGCEHYSALKQIVMREESEDENKQPAAQSSREVPKPHNAEGKATTDKDTKASQETILDTTSESEEDVEQCPRANDLRSSSANKRKRLRGKQIPPAAWTEPAPPAITKLNHQQKWDILLPLLEENPMPSINNMATRAQLRQLFERS